MIHHQHETLSEIRFHVPDTTEDDESEEPKGTAAQVFYFYFIDFTM
jgi:hypothetical protein